MNEDFPKGLVLDPLLLIIIYLGIQTRRLRWKTKICDGSILAFDEGSLTSRSQFRGCFGDQQEDFTDHHSNCWSLRQLFKAFIGNPVQETTIWYFRRVRKKAGKVNRFSGSEPSCDRAMATIVEYITMPHDCWQEMTLSGPINIGFGWRTTRLALHIK